MSTTCCPPCHTNELLENTFLTPVLCIPKSQQIHSYGSKTQFPKQRWFQSLDTDGFNPHSLTMIRFSNLATLMLTWRLGCKMLIKTTFRTAAPFPWFTTCFNTRTTSRVYFLTYSNPTFAVLSLLPSSTIIIFTTTKDHPSHFHFLLKNHLHSLLMLN